MSTIIFTLYAAAVAFVSLRPATGGGIEHMDKVFHLVIYCLFAMLGYRVVRAVRPYVALCLGIILYGGLMEVAQSFTPDRFMSGYDMIANTLGVVLGAFLVTRNR